MTRDSWRYHTALKAGRWGRAAAAVKTPRRTRPAIISLRNVNRPTDSIPAAGCRTQTLPAVAGDGDIVGTPKCLKNIFDLLGQYTTPRLDAIIIPLTYFIVKD